MSQYILAIDQGTTGTTSMLIDHGGFAVAKVNKEFQQLFPKPGWVEHDPEDIWQSVTETIGLVIAKAGVNPHDIAAIGITNQRETVTIWSRETNRPVHNAIVWQCRRTTDFCEKLKKAGQARKIAKKTGLVIDPYFSASKIRWLLKNVDGAEARARRGELAAGTIDSFLVWRLSGGKKHVTDVSNASRTQLMNIETGEWDDELLKLFGGVPRALLPEIVNSSGEIAKTKSVPGLPDGIPIAGMAGDQQAALFGQTCFGSGDAKCTFGTGSFLLMNTGAKRVASKSGILTTIAWRLQGETKMTYALEGGAFICGAAVQWLRDGLKLITRSSEIEDLARQVSDSAGVDFVPALTGLGAPYWDPEARGIITGLTRGSTSAHLARATLDAMAMQNLDILRAMQKDLGHKLRSLRVDGGATANNLLMQLQADYLGQAIERPRMIETTAIGAAFLAGLGVGLWKNKNDLKSAWHLDQRFEPKMLKKEQAKRVDQWHRAIDRARGAL